MSPAEAKEIIEQRFGKDTFFVSIAFDADSAVALGHLRAVGSVDQRDMTIDRIRPATLDFIHGADDRQLAECVIEMIVAADHMGNAHVVIIHHNGEHIGRGPVGTQQDIVVDLGILDRNLALNRVVDRGFPVGRNLEANYERHAVRGLAFAAVAPAAIIPHGLLVCPLFGSHLLQLFGSGEALIGVAGFQQLVGNFGMAFGPIGLEYRGIVEVETQPV